MIDLLLSVQQLSQDRKESMFSLFDKHFSGVKQNDFEADLQAKHWVILLEDSNSGELKGFTTLRSDTMEFKQERITTLYSGDTIVDPSAWSQSRLPQAWITAVMRLCQHYDLQKLYWLLISSGYRTYRFLPTFWKEFYPCCTTETPAYERELMQFLGRSYFGELYDEATGVVRFPHAYALREGLREIPPGRLQNRHIRFFTERNPGHTQGDNLVCLTEISRNNLTRAGRRIWPDRPGTEQFEPQRFRVSATSV